MALITRYFSTASAGSGDGTSWANRAALFSAGAWSTIITGFDFSSGDSLECRIGPGTYDITSALTGISTTAANKCILHGCDNSGNLLDGPIGWCSAQGEFDYSNFPVLSVGTITVISTPVILKCLRLVGSGAGSRTSVVLGAMREALYCVIEANNEASSTSFDLVSSSLYSHCILKTTCPNVRRMVSISTGHRIFNCRFEMSGATGGDRSGIQTANTNSSPIIVGNTLIGISGHAISTTTGFTTTLTALMLNNTVVNCGSTGILQANSQTPTAGSSSHLIKNNYVANCGEYGIRQETLDFATVIANRVRNCTLGNISNVEIQYDNITTAGTDAEEFVDAAGGDYRIKAGSAIWGLGIGAGDEPSVSGSSASPSIAAWVY